MTKRKTTEDFIIESKTIHGNVFDYSLVVYTNNKEKVKLKCNTHGIFEQRPDNHLNLKQGCPRCKRDAHIKRNTKTFKDFYKKASKKFGNKFLYDKDDFKGFSYKTNILCKEHGVFIQTPYKHLISVNGCPKCAISKNTKLPIELRPFMKKVKGVIQQSYMRKGFTKSSRTYELLDCTWEEFKEHLEDNPYGFKVGDTNIDLDHIIPISSAKSEEDLITLNHYTNFQLLPRKYNQNIKRNKPYSKKHFEEWLFKNNNNNNKL